MRIKHIGFNTFIEARAEAEFISNNSDCKLMGFGYNPKYKHFFEVQEE